MTCPNCGAKLHKKDMSCKYCGAENEAAARLEHEKELSGIRAKTEAFYKTPERVSKKATRVIFRVGIAAAAVVTAAAVLTVCLSTMTSEAKYRRQQRRIIRLEELYAVQNYAKMNDELEKIDDSYAAAYDKYTTIGDMYEKLNRIEKDLSETTELVKELPDAHDLLEYPIEELFEILYECERLEDAGFIYGESRAVGSFREQAKKLVKEELMLSDEELSAGISEVSCEQPDFSEFAKTSAERLAGGLK